MARAETKMVVTKIFMTQCEINCRVECYLMFHCSHDLSYIVISWFFQNCSLFGFPINIQVSNSALLSWKATDFKLVTSTVRGRLQFWEMKVFQLSSVQLWWNFKNYLFLNSCSQLFLRFHSTLERKILIWKLLQAYIPT